MILSIIIIIIYFITIIIFIIIAITITAARLTKLKDHQGLRLLLLWEHENYVYVLFLPFVF